MPAPTSGNVTPSVASAMPNTGYAARGSKPNGAAAAQNASTALGSTVSAPLTREPPAREVERAGVPQRARASAYEKLGPAVIVPRYSEIHSSQLDGLARKSCGAPSTSSKPLSIGVISSPMRPMSWYSGNQDTARSSWVIAAAATMASMFAPTQRSGSITPFGAAVEPLVNCRMREPLGVVGWQHQRVGADAGTFGGQRVEQHDRRVGRAGRLLG